MKRLREQITGTTSIPPRWETCLRETDGSLGDMAGKWFVQKTFAGK